ncbi:uncharacterized protein N7483_005888 [Penicillium malachiteum]|uniref:uncharacterized protein n=1 Tax=Penicillium malachiteum TaxID=1324776 RepID=UPI0025478725|nr:uncharacterized protein N7483_005888 [Penicillium malachiteum]KAJ5731380.1 hypothetical protein N7483_005888 [Penicillium malachiteum]
MSYIQKTCSRESSNEFCRDMEIQDDGIHTKDENCGLLHEDDPHLSLAKESTPHPTLRPLLIHGLLVTFYTLLFLFFFWFSHHKPVERLCRSNPVSVVALDDLNISYVPQIFNRLAGKGNHTTSLAGPPTPERDAAWREFSLPMNIRVQKDELDRSNMESVALPNGGFMGRLGFYHDIHCLALLRQWNYREHYYGDIDNSQKRFLEEHADHCIEMLRLSTMCHGDASLQTFKWPKDLDGKDMEEIVPEFDARSPSVHACVDWESLTDSLRGREVSRDEIKLLRWPGNS